MVFSAKKSSVALVGLFSASAAIAQDQMHAESQAQAPQTLPPITVTAQPQADPRAYTSLTNHTATKTNTPDLEVPFSIQSVTKELLNERKPWDFAKALETVPGVAIGYGGGFTQSGRARIRGFSNINNFKDGYRVSAQVGEVDLANVATIDVLKGPASALYGRFEPGGIINIVTKNPTTNRMLEGQLTGGSFGFIRGTFDAGGTIDNGGLLTTRFNGAFETTDGYRDFTNYDKFFLAPAFTLKLSDTTHLTVKAEFLKLDAPFDRGLPNNPVSLQVPPTRNYGAPWMRLEKSQWLTTAELNHKFSDEWRLKVGGQMGQTNASESYFNYGFLNGGVVGNNLTRTFFTGTEQSLDRTAQIELYGNVSTGKVRHKLLFGTEYNNDTWGYSLLSTAAPPVNIWAPSIAAQPPAGAFVPNSIGSYRYESFGFYAQDELAWGPLRLLAGARVDSVRGQVNDQIVGNTTQSESLWTFAPRVGLTYMITPELAVYASWAQSTRLEVDQGILQGGGLPQPTKGQQFEVGIKGDFWNNRLQPTLALFDITKDNAIVPSLINPLFVTQVGQIRVQGVEAQVAGRPLDPWRIIASLTYLNAHISQDTDPLLLGNQLQGVPAWEASLWTSWNFGTDDRGLTVGGGIFYSSDRPTSNANTLYTPSYTRLDLFASYAFNERTALQLNVNNVTNQNYYLVSGFSLLAPQPPLTAYITLTHKLF